MTNNSNQKNLIAQKRLGTAFDNLEKAILNKINQLRENNIENSNIKDNTDSKEIIRKLDNDVKSLQIDASDISSKNLLLGQKNEQLTKKIDNLQTHGSEIINNIKFDLTKIKSIINKI